MIDFWGYGFFNFGARDFWGEKFFGARVFLGRGVIVAREKRGATFLGPEIVGARDFGGRDLWVETFFGRGIFRARDFSCEEFVGERFSLREIFYLEDF